MFNPFNRSILRDGDPGAAGGTGSTGGQTGTPGTGGEPAKFVTVEDFGKTAALIRGLKASIETLTTSALTADRLAEIGLLEKGEDGSFRAKTAAPPAKKPDGGDDPLKRELDQLKAQLKAKDDAIAAERRKADEIERNRAVIAAMSKLGAINAERDHIHIAGQIIKTESGQFVSRSKGQYGEDVDTPIEDFVGSWLKSNPDLLKAQGAPGTGARPGQGTLGNGSNVVPKATWSNQEWYMRNRDKVVSGELVLGN